MKLREKTTATLLIAIFMVSTLAVIIPVMAKEKIEVDTLQTQFQWRSNEGQIGEWYDIFWNRNYGPSEYDRSGNVLHTEISYMPTVTEEEGTSMVYVYNKKLGHWIMHEGTIGYVSCYSGLWITEYWKGYLDFDREEPSSDTFVQGVQYQWGYVFGYDENTPPPFYGDAIWDETVGAWLLGMSIYVQRPLDSPYGVNVPFPDPFIEPVPKNNYNPEDL